jgi:sugar phosphate isomerase/epimerase
VKLGVSMWSYFHPWREGRLDIPGFIREAKRAGAEGVELLDFFYRDVEADRQTALAALEETGLPVPIFSVSQNFARPDRADRQKELDKILFGITEASFYGAEVVRVFAGDVAQGITFDQAREWIVEGLAEATVHAANHGVRLALENHGKLAGRGEQVRGIVEDVRARSGLDALGANPDTGNFLLVGQPSHEAIREVASLAYMVHFKDFRRAPESHEGFAYESLGGERFVGSAVGEGEVNLRLCLEELRGAGFEGWLSVEYEGEEDPFEAVPRSIANARRTVLALS